jgi:hypothetical protein
MEKEIIDFYASLELEIEKQIASRPKGISPGQIEAAAEFVYKRRDGIEPIMLVREIRRVAREIDVAKYQGADQLAREATKEIEKFRLEVEKLRGITEGSVRRFEAIGWTNRLLAIITMLMLLGVLVGVWR